MKGAFVDRLRAAGRAVEPRLHRLVGRELLHVLHIRKTAGTALRSTLKHHRRPPGRFLILHQHRTRLCDLPPGDRVILFLRDPVTRFVSGFLDRQREGRPRYNAPWGRDERRAFERFSSPEQLASALYSDDEPIRVAARDAMGAIRHLRYPYSYWLGAPDAFAASRASLFFIGFQERFEHDFERLCKLLSIDPRTPPADSFFAHRNPESSQTRLTTEGEAAVRRWFNEDYALLALARGYFPGPANGAQETPDGRT